MLPPDKNGKEFPGIRHKTVVEHVVDAIVRALAEGHLMPGDRVIERDLATRLGVSRAPIREALRLLESQGVVVNSPYRGMRVMDVDVEKIRQIIVVRAELECLAVREAFRHDGVRVSILADIDATVEELTGAAEAGDHYRLALADVTFHSVMFRYSDNAVLMGLWQAVERQLTVIFSLSSMGKGLDSVLQEHKEMRRIIAEDDVETICAAFRRHIVEQGAFVDLSALKQQKS